MYPFSFLANANSKLRTLYKPYLNKVYLTKPLVFVPLLFAGLQGRAVVNFINVLRARFSYESLFKAKT